MNVSRTDLKCEQCGRPGHVKKTCYEIIGFPDHWWESPRFLRSQQRFQQGDVASQQQKFQQQSSSSKPLPGVYHIPQQRVSYQQNVYQHQSRPQQPSFPAYKHSAHAVNDKEFSKNDSKLQALVAKMVEAQLDKSRKGKESMQEMTPVNYAYYNDFAGPQD